MGTAFTGTFNTLKLRELNPSLAETRIVAFTDHLGPIGLVSYAIDGSDPVRITTGDDLAPSTSATGKIVFQRLLGPVALAQQKAKANPSISTPGFPAGIIEMINMDGSGLTQLAPAGFYPTIDAAGDKIAFFNAGVISTENVSTKVVTPIPLPTNDSISGAVISPDGTTVYALLSLTGTYHLYAMPADGSGGSRTICTVPAIPVPPISISPDGSEVAVAEFGSPDTILRIGTGGGEISAPIPLLSGSFGGASYSADSKSFAVCTSFGSPQGIYTGTIASGLFSRITPVTATAEFPSWTPFIKDRILIAAGGGLLGTRACGVIQTQRAIGGTCSIVAFDVTTPSSVVMTAQPSSITSQTNIVFSVDADNITKLAYANGTAWRGIRAIGSGTPVTSANGALVSFDGSNGSISTILPFLGTRAAGSHPTIKDEGSTRTFSGQFLAAYDKDGKNLAPNGASTIRLDTKTNTITVG
jgi:Tol biopolymer transport system component